ncbi:hypothetical protein [Rhizobium sp. MHM7A]|uniref:hypothetical protein n=1 Tax=Rhizobium sp. MHM7A TaxID=2583233 RepID=UPI001106EFB5|nr:hypothetical protein [Rhizobium sp. MHM7A]TLX16641.1 hypothetical protein FFR93_04680 [Rhizobium sp. MHM7A]
MNDHEYDIGSGGFADWHGSILRFPNEIERSSEETETLLPALEALKRKYQALKASDTYVAAARLENELLLVNKTGARHKGRFKEFLQPVGVTDLNVGNSSLALHDKEIPAGAITLVMTVSSDKSLNLAHASINASDFATQAVFKEVMNFFENCLLRKPRSILWDEKQSQNLILSVSIWEGFIKFHNADQTFNHIMIETDDATFANHLRLSALLGSSAIERAVHLQVDDLLRKFEQADIIATPEQRKTIADLISRGRPTTGPQRRPEPAAANSLYDAEVLRLALTDFALLNGIDELKLPENNDEPRIAAWKPNTNITLPREEANAMIDSHTAERPFWYGRFWSEQDVEFKLKRESIGCAAACIKRINSLPYDEVINATIAFQPKAEPLLRRWREIWDRSFPGWQSLPKWHFDKSEKPTTEHFVYDIDRAFNWASNKSVSMAEGIAVFDNWIEDVSDDKRDYRLHVIDDADAVCAMVHLAPGAGFFNALSVIIQYIGTDGEGYPIFKEAEEAGKRVRDRLDSCPDYWNWPFYKKYLGRRGVVTKEGKHTAAVLADMALQGYSHAFLKGVAQKSGTWTVNLGGVTNLETAQQRLAGTLERDHVNEPMYVQEHVPFTHEQRYYIQGGRMFASACSDRNFSAMNSNGKRLDSRVAVLKRPSVDAGYYDRGQTENLEDRKTSAMFARQVRKIVAELREYGLQDYSIDMGLTERGMISVEVNTLHMAGPYNMRRELYTKQFERTRKRANDLLAKKACEIIRSSQLPEHIQQKAVAIAMASDNLVQLSLTFADAPNSRRASEEMKIAMLILLLAIISTANHENQTMTEAA